MTKYLIVVVILVLLVVGSALAYAVLDPVGTTPASPGSQDSVPAEGNLPPKPTPTSPEAPSQPAVNESFFIAAERGGRQEIFAADSAHNWKQLTSGYSPVRAPSLSPDGKQLLFQSRKDGNWEIYLLQLATGQVTRLTHGLPYDGAPNWSPDGKRIAFESFRDDDLDIWVMNADGSNAINLTPDEKAYDFGPAWSPDGSWIAYTSWSTGHKQLFLTSPDGKRRVNLSQNQFEDEQPAWSPDGARIAFVSNREGCEQVTDEIKLNSCQRREIYIADFHTEQLSNVRQITFSGHDTAPVWSPDGSRIAFVSPRPGKQQLYTVPANDGIASPVSPEGFWLGSAVWAGDISALPSTPPETTPLYVEKPVLAPADAGHPYDFSELRQIYLAPSWGRLSSRVTGSFLALRSRVQAESGNDFLGVLSDMARDILVRCDATCDNLSWHKSGRAIDTRLEYYDRAGQSLIEIVREDEMGETYWRLYLRAAVQDGSLGEPLKDGAWDYSYEARTSIAPDEGGVVKPPPYGYYVDFTELARLYGWERISSHDDPDFDWRWNKLAMEYWHYQKTDGLTWYQAITEVYAPPDIEYNFDWTRIQPAWGVESMRLFFKQIPPPPDAWKWYALIPGDR